MPISNTFIHAYEALPCWMHGSIPSPYAIRPHCSKRQNSAQSRLDVAFSGLPVISVGVVAKLCNGGLKQKDAFSTSLAKQSTNAAVHNAVQNLAVVVCNVQSRVCSAADCISATAHVVRCIKLQYSFAYRVSQFDVVAHGSGALLVCSGATVELAHVDKTARLNGWPATRVALTANRLHVQRIAIVAVVVLASHNAAVSAIKFAWPLNHSLANGNGNSGMRFLRCTAWFAGLAHVSSIAARNQINAVALNAFKLNKSGHLGSLLSAQHSPIGFGGQLLTKNTREVFNVRAVFVRCTVLTPLADRVVACDGVAALIELSHQGGFATSDINGAIKRELLRGIGFKFHTAIVDSFSIFARKTIDIYN